MSWTYIIIDIISETCFDINDLTGKFRGLDDSRISTLVLINTFFRSCSSPQQYPKSVPGFRCEVGSLVQQVIVAVVLTADIIAR